MKERRNISGRTAEGWRKDGGRMMEEQRKDGGRMAVGQRKDSGRTTEGQQKNGGRTAKERRRIVRKERVAKYQKKFYNKCNKTSFIRINLLNG